MSSRTIQAILTKAVASERNVGSDSSSNASLEAAITTAELYMQALKLSDSPSERKRFDAKCKQLLATAESIKSRQGSLPKSRLNPVKELKPPSSNRALTTRENIILLEDSKLNGFVFKPWVDAPAPSEFELREGEEPYLESPPMPLSSDQLRSFDGWGRPHEALPRIRLLVNGAILPNEPTMALPGKIDLVQDMAADCSVVASLCAGTARAERGHARILGAIAWPYDFDNDHLAISANGKYVLRLYFNGCWRRVDIDDMLPMSKTSRVLHVVDRSHPGLLWPALIEKAYLKVRGGYDFPGSNSGTDLAVLTGWIPQQVFLHDEDVDPNGLWTDLYDAFQSGNILLTIGTGKLPRREEKQLGLAAEHDYAILDVQSRGDHREMLIKNPWSDGDVWKGAVRRRPNPCHEHEEPLSPPLEDPFEMLPGTFWMEFNSVFQYFENMYINWNPGLFTQRKDIHFSWHIAGSPPVPNVFTDNPQFSMRSRESGEIWLLLNRHFRTGDYTHDNSGKNGYISLYLYDKNGFCVLSTEGAKTRGPFVDSPNTLLRFNARPHVAYTAVVVSQDLPPGKHNFTLSLYSRMPVQLHEAPSRYEHQSSLSAAWTRHTSGGNSDSPSYLVNPQFSMTIIPPDTSVAVAVRLTHDPSGPVDQTNIHIKLLLLYSPTQDTRKASDIRAHRISKLRSRDVVVSSGDYRRGSAVIETVLSPGTYTLICSTFDRNQLAKFSIDLYTSSPAKPRLQPVPSEGSGRLSVISQPAVFQPGIIKTSAPIIISRTTKAVFLIRSKDTPFESEAATATSTPSSSSYKLTIEQGQGSYRNTIASSATEDLEYTSLTRNNSAEGPRIADLNLEPKLHATGTGGLWLVLERSEQAASEETSTQVLEVEILCEERIEIGEWRVTKL